MRAVALCVVVAACGPGLARTSPRGLAQDAMVRASGDAAALEKLMRGELTNGGLWFADAGCAQFATPGPIAREQMHAFAGCLAGLHWQASERVDALLDVTVLTYAPGIEVEARVITDSNGPWLRWIGFAARRNDADSAPTISPSLLESLRVAGDGHPTTSDPKGYAWFKVCIDAAGSVSEAVPFTARSLQLVHELEPAIAAWKFKPSPVGPACSVVFVGQPPPPPLRLAIPRPPGTSNGPIVVAIQVLHRTSGEANIVPDDTTKIAMGASAPNRFIGSFRTCLDATGHVDSVVPVRPTGVQAYDAKIMREIKQTWVFDPYLDGVTAIPICTIITFIYSQH